MAKQKGIFPLKGTIGNVTFYKSKDGYLAREKGSLDGSRIANDPAFQRTRENGAEFGRAGSAGKVLRTALRTLIQFAADGLVVARLTKEMMKVVKADAVNPRGYRNVIDGEAELLEGFEFNADSKLSTSLYAPFTCTINRVTEILGIDIPSFIPATMVAAPSGSTHFKIVSAGAEIDFEQEVFTVVEGASATLPWDATPTAALNLAHAVTANSTHPFFLVLGIQFFQEVNGTMYPLKNGTYNALALVKVSG
ncbi:MAG: hypothetical protein HYX40_06360 [Sphingobacteriales bacterium]|nr:hypothetical protein [Sphingobacteriales bacterium]